MYGSAVSIILTIISAILSLISFDILFTIFHNLFFSGNSWLFNPADTIINIFPEKFFVDAFGFILMLSISISIALFILGWIIKKLK